MDAEDIKSGFISRADRVLLLIEEKRAGLAAPGAEQWQVLSLIRFHLLRAFNEFVVFKQDHILFPAILEDNGRGDGFAARLNTANLDVQRDYDAFVQNWMLKNPLSISERYRVEATKMMEEIERMVRLDKEAVIGLLDRKQVAD